MNGRLGIEPDELGSLHNWTRRRLFGHVAQVPSSLSPMRGDVKEKYSLRPLREEMDVAIGIQPNLRSGRGFVFATCLSQTKAIDSVCSTVS